MENTTTQPASKKKPASSKKKPTPTPVSTLKTPAAATESLLCFCCNRLGTKLCSICNNARYCSVKCQRADWKTHKLLCESYAKLEDRPGPDYARGIICPVRNAARPASCGSNIETSIYSRTIEFQNYFPSGQRFSIKKFDRNHRLERDLGYNIGVWDEEPTDLPTNPQLMQFLAPVASSKWHAEFIVQGYVKPKANIYGVELYEGKVCDLDTAALGPLLAFFRFKRQISHG